MSGPYDQAMSRRAPISTTNAALEAVSRLSHGDERADNRLIKGDNVGVLRALAGELTQAVRCIYIDPPYNTAERWTHFEDNRGHEEWLAELGRCMELLWPTLRHD